MPETVRKLDARRRAVFPDRFSPGDVFVEEQIDEDRVVFRLIRRMDPRPARLEKREGGRTMIAEPINRDRIRQALRAERDAR